MRVINKAEIVNRVEDCPARSQRGRRADCCYCHSPSLEVNGFPGIQVTWGPSVCCRGFQCSRFTRRGSGRLCPASGTSPSRWQEPQRVSLKSLSLQEMETYQTSLSKKGNSLEKQECCSRKEEGRRTANQGASLLSSLCSRLPASVEPGGLPAPGVGAGHLEVPAGCTSLFLLLAEPPSDSDICANARDS